MSEFTEANNTSTYVQPVAPLPLSITVEGGKIRHADCGRAQLADALATWAVNSGVIVGLADNQKLLWRAVQILVETEADARLMHLADALEIVTGAYAFLCQQTVYEVGGQTCYDAKETAFRRDCGAEVIELLKGIFAQMDRDTAAVAAQRQQRVLNGGAR